MLYIKRKFSGLRRRIGLRTRLKCLFRFLKNSPFYLRNGYPQKLTVDGFYSQYGQDRYLDEKVFGHIRDGVFVDIGAHDGVSLSNTFYFEKVLGWTGLAIEPQSTKFPLLSENRSCIAVCGCISNKSGEVQFLEIDGEANMLSGIMENYHPEHLKRIDHEVKLSKGSKKLVNSKSYTLEELVSRHNYWRIDYLSLDTEGGEFDILKTIDFEKIEIGAMSIENNYSSSDIRWYLFHKGFKLLARLAYDEIYLNRKYKFK